MATKERKRKQYFNFFAEGFIKGLGTAFGATVGFAVLISLLGFIIRRLGGLPVVGSWLADFIQIILVNLHLDQLRIK